MAQISTTIRRILQPILTFRRRPSSLSSDDIRELRLTFQARYLAFRRLIAANNRALAIMTDMEAKLKGTHPFGMSYIRACCTELSTQIFTIIQHLNTLAPDKYRDLLDVFASIKGKIQEELNSSTCAESELKGSTPLVVDLSAIDRNDADLVGPKMANLGEIRNHLGISVPEGFVITVEAFRIFVKEHGLQEEIARRIQSADRDDMDDLYRLSTWLQRAFLERPVPKVIQSEIYRHLKNLKEKIGHPLRLALRSSALGEDTGDVSFAGQYRSILNVSEDSIFDAYREVIASLYNLTAMTYRYRHGLLEDQIAMAVGCLAMVDALAGGVIYTRHPFGKGDEILIHATWGLPKAIVDGSGKFDEFLVSRTEPHRIIEKCIRDKERKYICFPDEGVCRFEVVGKERTQPSLTDDMVISLASMAMMVENHYGEHQDIEWAIDSTGRIVFLQTRPLRIRKDVVSLRDEIPDDSVLLHGGTTASSGIASGHVFFLKRNADLLRVPKGAVLVAAQALPIWASALQRASAVVTEEGSAVGHLAHVAREFGVPALFGVPDAMKVLKENQVITVDADRCVILEGVHEVPRLDSGPMSRPRMVGTPVHNLLIRVTSHIIPLNLLDPDSPQFHPRACRTYHDITRFCHEKAVLEMFRFGVDHAFPEKSSKRLVTDVPMQFWVLDLDGGFTEEVQGSNVSLDQIACRPMIALWEGMTAVPWEGPPPVDTRGFFAILHEATANPYFDPALSSPYAVKNYFMISRDFCSLQSRFGFHFSLVEAYVSERTRENYVSFRFKGGAANLRRRVMRTVFVGEILENYGFRTTVQEDSLFARIESYPEEIMLERLKIIGYLIIHTRQLDMVMNDPISVARYREKFLGDLSALQTAALQVPKKDQI